MTSIAVVRPVQVLVCNATRATAVVENPARLPSSSEIKQNATSLAAIYFTLYRAETVVRLRDQILASVRETLLRTSLMAGFEFRDWIMT